MSKVLRTRIRYALVGADYSAQEPRMMVNLCKSPELMQVYKDKKDLYAVIASKIFKKDYWECMEHYEDGTPNPDGKALRSKGKQLVLATLYGMGPKLMGEFLGISIEESKQILEEFFKMFPDVKTFTRQNEIDAKEKGFVEDYLGRRRHLPDAQLPELNIQATKDLYIDKDIFLDSNQIDDKVTIIDENNTIKWQNIYNTKYKDKGFAAKVTFKDIAKNNGINIQDNGAFISKALTQCTNSRVQGSSATLTKKAMINIDKSDNLNKIDFRLLIPIHDELLGECPIVYVDEAEQYLSEAMVSAAEKPECIIDMKVDTYVVSNWYLDEITNKIYDKYIKFCEDLSSESAIKLLYEEYPELSHDMIDKVCNKTYSLLSGEL